MRIFSVMQRVGILAAVMTFITTSANAGGFAILEQSGRGLGSAFAGATTGFGDGSSAFFNPAAMTRLEGDTYTFTGHVIYPESKFDNQGSTLAAALGGTPTGGGEGGNGGNLAKVPNIYAIKNIFGGKGKAAFSVNSPFGLVSEFDNDWVGRYHAVRSDVLTINLSPSVAYKFSEHISFGAGVDFMYADAELTNAIDFGSIGVATLGPATAVPLGLTPQGADGFSRVTGDDWGYGYHVGALVTYGDTNVGVHFRSKVDLSVTGDAEFTVPTAATPLTATGSFTNTGATANISLPETLLFDVHHQINDRLGLALGAIWTRWTRLQELRVEFDSTQGDAVTPLDWDTTWRFAGGATYKLNDKLVVRSGLSWEETPIGGGEFRTPRIPDDDRFWVTAGATYAISKQLFFDVSYAHIFFPTANSSVVSSTGDTLEGEYDLSVDILSLSLTFKG